MNLFSKVIFVHFLKYKLGASLTRKGLEAPSSTIKRVY